MFIISKQPSLEVPNTPHLVVIKQKMKIEQCPICSTELEIKEVTPCIECGALSDQVSLLKQDIDENFQHDSIEFNEYRVFGDFKIILCDFCSVDFGSHDPKYFGLSNKQLLGYEKIQFLKKIYKPTIGKDKYCPDCKQRLSFINFIIKVRNKNIL